MIKTTTRQTADQKENKISFNRLLEIHAVPIEKNHPNSIIEENIAVNKRCSVMEAVVSEISDNTTVIERTLPESYPSFNEYTNNDYSYTKKPLDLAIDGNGYFQVSMPDGTTAYTRDGIWRISEEGHIVTNEGYPMVPKINVPDDAVSIIINTDGAIKVDRFSNIGQETIGQIELVRFDKSYHLKNIGRNLYRATSQSGIAVSAHPSKSGLGNVIQGYLEISNINVIDEMTNMMAARKTYRLTSKKAIG